MNENIDMFFKSEKYSLKIHCIDPGFGQGLIITDSDCFEYFRKSKNSGIIMGIKYKDKKIIEGQSKHFNNIFDSIGATQDDEINTLKQFINKTADKLLLNF